MPYSFLVTQPKLLVQSVIATMLGWLIACSLATGERPLPAKPPGAYFPLHTKDHANCRTLRMLLRWYRPAPRKALLCCIHVGL